MIEVAPHNAVNFTSDFMRQSKYFDARTQRTKCILSSTTGVFCFYYHPAITPDAAPDMTLYANLSNGTTVNVNQTHVYDIDGTYIYMFNIALIGLISGDCDFYAIIAGEAPIFSEKCVYYNSADLPDLNIVRLISYNSDFLHGYLSSEYPATAFFQISELNRDVFANEKTIYTIPGEGEMILESINYLKRRVTFINLSMYQQNLLKWMANCEVFSINSTQYRISGDFIEKNKDENNEICDLQADFIRVNSTGFMEAATESAIDISANQLFMH